MKPVNPSFLKPIFPWIIWKGPKNQSSVYITFDDGPHPEYTPEVLRILKKFNVKAAFFLTGQNILLYPGIVEQILKEGHTICNHGFSHKKLSFQKQSFVIKEIEKTDQSIQKITGQNSVFFRPPYGRFDLRFKRWMKETGHQLILWSLLSCDFKIQDPIQLQQFVKFHLHPGAIIVFHDGHRNTPVLLGALSNILQDITEAGYTMTTLHQFKDHL